MVDELRPLEFRLDDLSEVGGRERLAYPAHSFDDLYLHRMENLDCQCRPPGIVDLAAVVVHRIASELSMMCVSTACDAGPWAAATRQTAQGPGSAGSDPWEMQRDRAVLPSSAGAIGSTG